MYQVSERVKKQFEYTMSIPCVKEAMKFIQDDERNTIEEQKELENKAESELSGIQLEEANIRQKVEFAQTNVERINGDLEKFETEKTGLLENAKNSKECGKETARHCRDPKDDPCFFGFPWATGTETS